MNVTSYGAAREVTGSCHMLETPKTRVCIDCGMFQGSAFNDARNFQPFGFTPKDIDAVVITHAHLDHVGRLPKLIKEGFTGKVYLTPPTADMTQIVLEDAMEIMEEQFEKEYRPKLYEQVDLERALELLLPMDYNTWTSIGDIRFRFREAGHIFGSAFVEIEETGGPRIAFSGDIGNVDTPILRPTAQIGETDVVYIESTYGNRVHEDMDTRAELFENIVRETIKKKGVLLIPAFAIERTQAVLYDLNRMFEEDKIEVDVYLDSPMAIKMTDVIKKYPKYYDKEAAERIMHGDNFLSFPHLTTTQSRADSKKINESPRPKIIIAGSGMMNGGRILHHLQRYLGDSSSTVLIVGYQASGTIGRRLHSGEKRIRVMDEMINVRANIASIGSFSAHGDQHKLLNWIRGAKKLPSRVYCTHGEDEACVALATRMQDEFHVEADAPHPGVTVQIS